MERERIPDSGKHPLSTKAGYADPHLYGGAAFIVGLLALVLGVAFLLLGNIGYGGFLALLGGILALVGVVVARRGE